VRERTGEGEGSNKTRIDGLGKGAYQWLKIQFDPFMHLLQAPTL
jgi:hypothetical protein